MKTVAGLWIDHRKAVVVTLSDKGEETRQIQSNVEKQRSRIDGVQTNERFETSQLISDDKQETEFTEHISSFYKEVLESIKHAELVLLLGPGEAKDEFKKFMKKHDHSGRIAAEESVEKLTDPQIAAKVRDFFSSHKAN